MSIARSGVISVVARKGCLKKKMFIDEFRGPHGELSEAEDLRETRGHMIHRVHRASSVENER
jgi:hypothetical protein